jgi:hypothetical protein
MQEKLKYNINKLIDELPRSMTIGAIEKILKKEHGISRDTFYRDRFKTINENSIPSERLDVYAALFNVPVSDLKNYTVKAKPFSERHPSPQMKRVIQKTKLKKS